MYFIYDTVYEALCMSLSLAHLISLYMALELCTEYLFVSLCCHPQVLCSFCKAQGD